MCKRLGKCKGLRSINGAHGYVIFGTNRVTKLAYSAPEHVVEVCVVDVFCANNLKPPKTYGLESIRTFFLSFDFISCFPFRDYIDSPIYTSFDKLYIMCLSPEWIRPNIPGYSDKQI